MPNPPREGRTNAREIGTSRNVLSAIYCAVFFSPTPTGSIGIPAFEWSPTAIIASAQKWLGVQTKTKSAINQGASAVSCPVAAAQPAKGAQLPAEPPNTMFRVVRRFKYLV